MPWAFQRVAAGFLFLLCVSVFIPDWNEIDLREFSFADYSTARCLRDTWWVTALILDHTDLYTAKGIFPFSRSTTNGSFEFTFMSLFIF